MIHVAIFLRLLSDSSPLHDVSLYSPSPHTPTSTPLTLPCPQMSRRDNLASVIDVCFSNR